MPDPDDRYTIISADAHCGLPAAEYRPFLDERHHQQFDDYLAEQQASRDEALKLNYDYIMGWETENEEGLRGAFDPVQRDKELDADGVVGRGDVRRRRRHHRHGLAAVRRRPRARASIDDPELAYAGARAHNRFLVEMCSHSPERRGGIALVPIAHDIERGVEPRSSGWPASPASGA